MKKLWYFIIVLLIGVLAEDAWAGKKRECNGTHNKKRKICGTHNKKRKKFNGTHNRWPQNNWHDNGNRNRLRERICSDIIQTNEILDAEIGVLTGQIQDLETTVADFLVLLSNKDAEIAKLNTENEELLKTLEEYYVAFTHLTNQVAQLTMARGPKYGYARIEVLWPEVLGPVVTTNCTVCPEWLEGTMYSQLANWNGYSQWGEVEFKVVRSGVLMLACHFENEGSGASYYDRYGQDWTLTRMRLDGFEAQGWINTGHILKGHCPRNGGRVFRILTKVVEEGEVYSLRCNKYEPPYPIEIDDDTNYSDVIESFFAE